MSQKLQEAVAAARAGETETAQRLLAGLLLENPDEVHAWFLLSHLVESESKQIAYLKKVVALDPTHAKARQRLKQVQPSPMPAGTTSPMPAETTTEDVSPLPISTDPFDYEAQADAETIPEWMVGDEAATLAATAVAATESAADEPMEIPDWLQTSLEEEIDEEEEIVPVVPATTTASSEGEAIEAARQAARQSTIPAAAPDPDAETREVARLNRLLTLLVIFAVLIVLGMVYVFFYL
ncbi:MAG: hypothetical protein R6X32_09435 [Chloroflexota bacterium]